MTFCIDKYPYRVYNVTEVIKMEETNCCECCKKTKERSEAEYKSLINRLKRIEGQVRGLKRMLDENAYCTDILTQAAAVSSAVNAFSKELLGNHIRSCVADNIRMGNDEIIDELLDTLRKVMK